MQALKKTTLLMGGIFVLLYIAKSVMLFQGPNDGYYSSVFGTQIMQLIF